MSKKTTPKTISDVAAQWGNVKSAERLKVAEGATISVHSSHGDFSIDARTGYPMDALPETLPKILRFNLAEYADAYPKEPAPSDLDILDVGYWYSKNGKRHYEPPEPDFRARVKSDAEEVQEVVIDLPADDDAHALALDACRALIKGSFAGHDPQTAIDYARAALIANGELKATSDDERAAKNRAAKAAFVQAKSRVG